MLKDNMKFSGTLNEKISAGDAEKLKAKIKRNFEEKGIDIKERKEKKEKNSAETLPETEKSKISKNTVKVKKQKTEEFSVNEISVEKLREAVIWSEILGKPVCKKHRNKRRSCGGYTCR